MENLRQDYRRLFKEATAVNNHLRVRELFESLLNEIGVPDPGAESRSSAFGAACAAAKNAEGKGPDAKKL